MSKPIAPARVSSLLTAMENSKWKDKRHSARLPLWASVICKWAEKQVTLRSINISETGMLLEPSIDPPVGQEVSLEFKIAEVRASINVRAKAVRKEGTERVAVQFIDLSPEDLNAIQVYIVGRLKEQTPPRPTRRAKPARLWPRNE